MRMISIGIIVYIVFCLLTALCGLQRRMGFFGTLLFALLLTPPFTLLILLLTGPSHRHLHHYRQ